MALRYDDRIYGAEEIDDPPVLALLESAAVRRLERVLQHGISGFIGLRRPTTRFEHSVGALLLVRRLGGDLREQMAALLHDISHTAFSHVVDYVFDDHHGQSFHEEMKEPYLASSDVPATLARFGIDWRSVLHEDEFPLLEQPAPALCADRLDYFFRDAHDLGLFSREQIGRALAALAVEGGRIVVTQRGIAREMAEAYLAADEASWASFREVGLYELAARAIRLALDRGILSRDDLWLTDAEVWGRMRAAGDRDLDVAMALVSADTGFEWDEAAPTFRIGTKLRSIDPPVLLGGIVVPLSELDPEWGAKREGSLLRRAGLWPIRVVPPRRG